MQATLNLQEALDPCQCGSLLQAHLRPSPWSSLIRGWRQTLTTSRHAHDCLLSHPNLPTRALSRCHANPISPVTQGFMPRRSDPTVAGVSLDFDFPEHPPLQEEMALWPDLQYCNTDHIATKGVVFCKFSQSSAALHALDSIVRTGMVR